MRSFEISIPIARPDSSWNVTPSLKGSIDRKSDQQDIQLRYIISWIPYPKGLWNSEISTISLDEVPRQRNKGVHFSEWRGSELSIPLTTLGCTDAFLFPLISFVLSPPLDSTLSLGLLSSAFRTSLVTIFEPIDLALSRLKQSTTRHSFSRSR